MADYLSATTKRYMSAAGPGGAATIAIFWLMNFLISNGLPAVVEEQPTITIDILRSIEENHQLPERPDKPEKPEKLEQPPMPVPQPVKMASNTGVGWVPLAPNITPTGPTLEGSRVLEGAPIPMVRPPPIYPASAAQRGLEGWVRLQFDITQTGSVDNVLIVEEEPTGVFGRAATKALNRWRYKPEIIGGRPVRRTDVEVVLTFKLDQS